MSSNNVGVYSRVNREDNLNVIRVTDSASTNRLTVEKPLELEAVDQPDILVVPDTVGSLLIIKPGGILDTSAVIQLPTVARTGQIVYIVNQTGRTADLYVNPPTNREVGDLTIAGFMFIEDRWMPLCCGSAPPA